MRKYFYFAVIRFEEVVSQGDGRTKRVPVTHYGRNYYDSAEAALSANVKWIADHLGERFTVVSFDKQLLLDDRGIANGFIEPVVQNDNMPF